MMISRKAMMIGGGTLSLLFLVCATAPALKVIPPPKARPSVKGKAAGKKTKGGSPGIQNEKPQETAESLAFTGVEIVMPKGMESFPLYRIADADASLSSGEIGGWFPFVPYKPQEGETLGAEPETFQRMPLLPGSYRFFFSLPLKPQTPIDFTVPVIWSQPVKVRKGKTVRLEAEIPSIAPDQMARILIKPGDTMAPFNALTLKRIEDREKLGGQWDYFAPSGSWPADLPLTLMKGRYRAILSSPLTRNNATYRYELPEPLTITGPGDVSLMRPEYRRLNARLFDKKEKPIPGAPLFFHGPGETQVITHSRGGEISILLPVARYTVRAQVFDEKDGQREVTLSKNLDMTQDQTVTWKAPVAGIDFGFGK